MAKKVNENRTSHPVWGDSFSEEEIGLMNSFMHGTRLMESSDKSGIKAGNTSAYGYYQFTSETMKGINSNYNVNLSYNSREEQHYGMMLLTKEHANLIKSAGRKITPEELYKAHFLGAGDYKKFVKATYDNPNATVQSVLPEAYSKNKELLKGSVSQANDRIGNTINKGISKYNKEKSTPRAKEIENEIGGYFIGKRTPLSKDPGSYKKTGNEKWELNPTFPNGQGIGTQNMDYVIDIKDGKKTIIPKKGTTIRDVKLDTPVEDYDFSKVFEGTAESSVSDFNKKSTISGDSKSGYSFSDVEDYGGNPSAANLRAEQNLKIRGFKSKDDGMNLQELQQVAQTSAARYTDEELALQAERAKAPGPNTPGQIHTADDYGMLTPELISAFASHSSNKQYKNGGNIMKYELGGGLIQDQTGNNLVSFDEGGTHEQNPLGGIPQNTNPDGSVNTVEEGETKQGDYVFSDRLTITEEDAEELMLPEKVVGMTYAEASKYINKILDENANDAIVKRTVARQLDNLKLGNEKAKMESQEAELALDTEFLEGKYSNEEQEPVQDPSAEMLPTDNENEGVMGMEEQFSLPGETEFSLGGNIGGQAGNFLSLGMEMVDEFDMDDEVATMTPVNPGSHALKLGLSGAAKGASIGSAIVPGLGTAIGAGAGALIGGIGGLISGNKGKKRVEEAIRKQKRKDNLTAISDFRTDSGYKEFSNGGPLYNTTHGMMDFTEQFDNVPNKKVNAPIITPFSLPNNLLDNPVDEGTMDEMIIEVPRKELELGRPDPTQFQGNTEVPNNTERPLGIDYEFPNMLKYAGLFGARDNMRRANATPDPTEIYQASGTRFAPRKIDENLLLSKLSQMAGTTEHSLIGASGGSGAAARANILAANQHNTGQVADAMIKMEDYNNNQEFLANQHNNALDQYKDTIVNKQISVNEGHRQANEDARIIARNNYIKSLSELGKQMSQAAIIKRATGKDQQGNEANFKEWFEDFLKNFKG